MVRRSPISGLIRLSSFGELIYSAESSEEGPNYVRNAYNFYLGHRTEHNAEDETEATLSLQLTFLHPGTSSQQMSVAKEIGLVDIRKQIQRLESRNTKTAEIMLMVCRVNKLARLARGVSLTARTHNAE